MIEENPGTIQENAICMEGVANPSGNKEKQQAEVLRQKGNETNRANLKAKSINSEGKKAAAFPKPGTDREKSAQKQIEGLREFSAFRERIPRDKRGNKKILKC